MDPVISKLDYAQHTRLHDAAPDRSIGILAAYDYLDSRITRLSTNIAIPAIGILIIALCVAVVAWAVR